MPKHIFSCNINNINNYDNDKYNGVDDTFIDSVVGKTDFWILFFASITSFIPFNFFFLLNRECFIIIIIVITGNYDDDFFLQSAWLDH